MECNLKSIAQCIKLGCFHGHDPNWDFKLIDIEKQLVSQSSLNYIADLIEQSYSFGEVIEDDDTGYWQLVILPSL